MKIILVDDDSLVLQSLKIIIENSDIEVIGTFTKAQDAIEFIRETSCDLILMDIRMEPMDGIECTEKIKKIRPDLPIIMLTTFKDKEYICQAIEKGASGYILKDKYASLVSSIYACIEGNFVGNLEVIQAMQPQSTEHFDCSELTERELSILKLVAQGYNNKEISSALYLSEGTVRNYISNMLTKLDLRDRTQLAIYYYKK